MVKLTDTLIRIAPVDEVIAAETQQLLDEKTKPQRSLGRLEALACQVAAIRRTTAPLLHKKVIVVMGADHGVVEEGVSAYPQAVTAQMMRNFALGGAAINVLARQAQADLLVIDMGVGEALPVPSVDDATLAIEQQRIGSGTKNFTKEASMTRAQLTAALETGIAIAQRLEEQGFDLIGIGEMGIGNSTAASALTCALTGAPPAEVTGRGTGIDDATWHRKVDAIRRGLALHGFDHAPASNSERTLSALERLGGFEIAGLCGLVLGAACRRIPVVMDGFIASVAALAAVRLAPNVASYLIASHRSVEVGHRCVLQEVRARPLLDLELRLGEGTGAALAMPLVDASLRILAEMATFASAQVEKDTDRP